MEHEFVGVPVYGSWVYNSKDVRILQALFFNEADAAKDVERLKATNVTAEMRPVKILKRNSRSKR